MLMILGKNDKIGDVLKNKYHQTLLKKSTKAQKRLKIIK